HDLLNEAQLIQVDTFNSDFTTVEYNCYPDVQLVYYVMHPEVTLWRSRIDGSDRRQLTYPPMYTTMPRWSPDGKRISFQGAMPSNPVLKILLIAAAGRAQRVVLPEDRMSEDNRNLTHIGN